MNKTQNKTHIDPNFVRNKVCFFSKVISTISSIHADPEFDKFKQRLLNLAISDCMDWMQEEIIEKQVVEFNERLDEQKRAKVAGIQEKYDEKLEEMLKAGEERLKMLKKGHGIPSNIDNIDITNQLLKDILSSKRPLQSTCIAEGRSKNPIIKKLAAKKKVNKKKAGNRVTKKAAKKAKSIRKKKSREIKQ